MPQSKVLQDIVLVLVTRHALESGLVFVRVSCLPCLRVAAIRRTGWLSYAFFLTEKIQKKFLFVYSLVVILSYGYVLLIRRSSLALALDWHVLRDMPISDCSFRKGMINVFDTSCFFRNELNFSVFWVVTQCKVVWNRCVGTTYRSHLQGSSCPRRIWDREVIPKRRLKTTLLLVITQKTEEFSSVAAETNDLAFFF